MADVIKAPAPLPARDHRRRVFLAGSIEMGAAVDWQADMIEALAPVPDLLILSPRRDHWDPTWTQSIDNPVFREQVEWELEALEGADQIGLYFAPGTSSPISLLELGLFARHPSLVVCAPEGFWRKGNIDIVCKSYGIRQVATLAELTEVLACNEL